METKHAVFEWNKKKEGFIIRDLGSMNGVRPSLALVLTGPITATTHVLHQQTYVNSQPLRGSSTMVKHGDAIRFGYGEHSP